MQTDRVTATRELAKKVADFMVSLQPQATVDNTSSEVNLLKKQVELLQQQLTGFQQPCSGASTVGSAEAIGPAGTPPFSQPTVPLPTVHESANEPGTSDQAVMVKGPDGSTKLLKQGPKATKHPLFHAFQKAVPDSDGVHEVAGSSSGGCLTGKTSKDGDHTDASMALEYGTARHVEAVVTSVDDAKKRFLVKQWTPCKNDKDVMAWIDKVTLSKANRAKLTAWITHVQQWHQALTAHEQAWLDAMVSDWGIPIRDIAKLKASSLLKILAVGTVLLA